MPDSPKPFVWYELMTTDIAAAEAFYRAVIGWTAEPWGAPGSYTIMSAGDDAVCGLMTMPDEVKAAGGSPVWLGYILADDVDAATSGLKQAGGAVHRQPDDIPEIGRFSVVADPQGATFMLFSPKGGPQPAAPPMALGHVGWRELYAADGDRAFDFYSSQFGWTKSDALDMGPMGTYQLFAAGGDAIGGIMTRPDPSMPPGWLFYFGVEAIEAAIARVKAAGGEVLMGPQEVPGGAWIIQAKDPQGAMFALVGPKR